MILRGIPTSRQLERYVSARTLVAGGLGFLLLAFVVPILFLLWQSLNFGEGSLFAHYERVTDGIYVQILLRSFYYGALTTVVTLVLGYALAYFIAFRSARPKFMLGLVVLPLWVAYIIRYLGLQLFFVPTSPFVRLVGTDFGVLFSTTGVVLGLTSVFLPFAILPIYHSLNSIDRSLVQASRVLGANQLRTLRSIVVPLSLSGVVAGGLIVFILATGSFLAPAVLGGPGNSMIANLIEQSFTNLNNLELAAALSVIYTAVLGAVIVVFNMYLNIGRVLGDL